jgi:hypothetical protein
MNEVIALQLAEEILNDHTLYEHGNCGPDYIQCIHCLSSVEAGSNKPIEHDSGCIVNYAQGVFDSVYDEEEI